MNLQIDVKATVGQLNLRVCIEGGTHPIALVGPNGAGKTTLLRLLAGAHRPTSGVIKVSGRTLFDSNTTVDVSPERRRVGYVPQGYGLFPNMSALDNVAFGLVAASGWRARRAGRERAQALLDEMECGELASALPHELSGGERQKVALARALAIAPEVLLLDEPLAALDIGARRSLRRFLAARLAKLECPCLLVTHDVRDVESFAAEICVMDRGQLVQRGSVAELKANPANDFVAEFVGE